MYVTRDRIDEAGNRWNEKRNEEKGLEGWGLDNKLQ